MVYELFVTKLTAPAFSAKDVLDLYLHRGSFETVLADEDVEQDPDRWCSHTPNGQEFWQILSQWTWNLRLELGQHLSSTSMRTTECAAESSPAVGSRAGGGQRSSSSRKLWPCSMGTPVVYRRFSRIGIHPTT
jgi:hypothetical protein